MDFLCVRHVILATCVGGIGAVGLWPRCVTRSGKGAGLALCVFVLGVIMRNASMNSDHCRALHHADPSFVHGFFSLVLLGCMSFYVVVNNATAIRNAFDLSATSSAAGTSSAAAAAGVKSVSSASSTLGDFSGDGSFPGSMIWSRVVQVLRCIPVSKRALVARLLSLVWRGMLGAALPLLWLLSSFWTGFDCFHHVASNHTSPSFVSHEAGHALLAGMWVLYAYLPFFAASATAMYTRILQMCGGATPNGNGAGTVGSGNGSPRQRQSMGQNVVLETMTDCGKDFLITLQTLEGIMFTTLGSIFFIANNIQMNFVLWHPLMYPMEASSEFGLIHLREQLYFIQPPMETNMTTEFIPMAERHHIQDGGSTTHAMGGHAEHAVYRHKDQQHLSQASLWIMAGAMALVLSKLRYATPVHFVIIAVSQALMNYFHDQTTGHGMLLHQTHVLFLLLAALARATKKPVECSLLIGIAATHFVFSSTCFMESFKAYGLDSVSVSIVITVGVVAIWSWQCFCWLHTGGNDPSSLDGPGADENHVGDLSGRAAWKRSFLKSSP